MAAPKGKISTYTSGQQEMDLNLSLGGSFNCEKPNEISMPQSFSQIRASTANNPAFQRAIEIVRSDLHNKLEDTSKIYGMLNVKNKEQGRTTILNVIQINMILRPPENNCLYINKERGEMPNTSKIIALLILYSSNVFLYEFMDGFLHWRMTILL
ncbi:hypothetical protein H5410_005786 [Solanum commersonii]|uniref:Uncharacterized protein n=1 Tax=Solanum commersonii TaxID=4109 RepID=A0A9J6A841_SOLCO|nr:hypothetical protein H5410_005786 [Solanum commersonii]